MSSGPNWSFLLTQLNYNGPIFLVYIVAALVALVNFSRMWLPALLTISGVGLLAVTTIVTIAAQQYLTQSRPENWQTMMTIVAVGGSCFRACGMGLVVSAVFVGRSPISPGRYLDENE